MVRLRRAVLLALLLVAPVPAAPAGAQEAPLFTVLPRAERARQLEQRGDLHMVRKRYHEAADSYQQALRLSPQSPVLLNKTGIAYHQLARLDDAKKFYERATKADENYAFAWNNLGTVHYRLESYRRAERSYRKALKLDPTQAAFHSNLGMTHFARKHYPEAMEEFRVALLLDAEVLQRHGAGGVVTQDLYVPGERARLQFLLAKTFASLGNVEQVVFYLRHAMDNGLPPAEAQADPAFAALRNDERFLALFQPEPPLSPR
ncbi:MAG: tetratricopeptide repeat protein [Acidobacteria bacterium]|nr:tetratricopeptide repeat protein [Acidobacteriota bacterium]